MKLKYSELNDASQTKGEIQNTNQNNMNNDNILGLNSAKDKQSFPSGNYNTTSANSSYNNNYNKKSSILLNKDKHKNASSWTTCPGSRKYEVDTDTFKIWVEEGKKIMSYHSIEYSSIANPKNSLDHTYLLLNNKGEYFFKEGLYEDNSAFSYDDFLKSLNRILNEEDYLKNEIRKYMIIRFIWRMFWTASALYLSGFMFMFIYWIMCTILTADDTGTREQNYLILLIGGWDLVASFVFLYWDGFIEPWVKFKIFRHCHIKKDKLMKEIKVWNEKAFNLINKQAKLAENFSYIDVFANYN